MDYSSGTSDATPVAQEQETLVTKDGQQKIRKTLPGLISGDFCCNI